MNASQLVQSVIEAPQFLSQQVLLIEKLAIQDATALVSHLVQAFHAYQLWPQDAACLIAACRPTDEQLLQLLKDERERCQKLGLHILAQLIDAYHFQQQAHTDLAIVVLSLLRTEVFWPRRKYMRSLEAWAKSHSFPGDAPPA
ncbi:hypothetical protein C5Y96_26300 [Blastopirellula marina]|uniref:Uncharacterized protein n=1 Tax=Blastopirellula marina TaxID=124 RepID=A0A2S8EYM9_9BACT|nr:MULTISPECIES: hypothetical protein [Pirellulaceae]PQO25019.1 hypothetical protein C5Y96_26300 [Blastopirellula marina]RCS40871.1 hypothetical protein DTL36_26350 [Bremerella cremea]